MAAYESSVKSLLQGVSQQRYSERLDGQLTAQENMQSDPVTGLRRRTGLEYAFNIASVSANKDNIVARFTDVAGSMVHILMNLTTGVLRVLDGEDFSELASFTHTYLQASTRRSIRMTSVSDELFILNTEKVPALVPATDGVAPSKRGFFYIAAGSFSRAYSVTIQTSLGTYTATYTTPAGSGANDAALATPAYIAGKLQGAIATNKATVGLAKVLANTAYVYVEAGTGADDVVVTSSTGSAYIVPSKGAYLTSEGMLPATLPTDADGFIMAAGDMKTPKYYVYESATSAWLESGKYGSPVGISNMPISLTKVGGAWTLLTDNFDGRYAGDDESNPVPYFVEYGLTGMSAYQGRLVLLSGPRALLSGSNKPRRVFRSTIASLLDSDPIEIGSSANSSASYEYALPFNKDLVLMSSKYQAVIPSGNAILTPRTANIVLTSSFETDTHAEPVVAGRTLLYPFPRSQYFNGVMEMIPSPYTDSQYVSDDMTPHIPKYIPGRCRFTASSSVANIVLFAPAGDTKSLIVYEYQWSGDTKVQQAWHRWSFQYDVAAAYFANNTLIVLFAQDGQLVGCKADPRAGALTFSNERRPFSDLHFYTSAVGRTVTLPAWLVQFDPAVKDKVMLTASTGGLAGDEVGFKATGDDTLEVVRSFADADVAVGVRYYSGASPTQPSMKDRNEKTITSNKLTILHYMVSTKNSSAFDVILQDGRQLSPTEGSVPTLYWSSTELALGRGKFADESVTIIPARTEASTTSLVLGTDGPGELNIVALEFLARYHSKIRRR